MKMENAHVVIKNVKKTFGNTLVLDDVSLEIAKGSFTTLLGPSGCGKTTILRTLAGFYQVESGEISIGGNRINEVPSHLRNAIMVFQDYALFPHMNIKENITYGLRIQKVPKEEMERRLKATSEYLDIGRLLERTPGQISGGQQQRVALARALVMEPEVLLLDEPLSNLDAKLRITIRAELRQLQQRLKITTIYVTHDQAEALAMSDTIAVMNAGKVMQIGSPSEIYYRPQNTFVASFIGTANFISGVMKERRGDSWAVELVGGRILQVKEPKGLQKVLRIGAAVTLMARPESIKILRPGIEASGAEGGNIIKGKVVRSIFEGSTIRYWVDALGGEILIDQFDPGDFVMGNGPIEFYLDKEKIHIMPKE